MSQNTPPELSLSVNGESRALPPGATVRTLVERLRLDGRRVAVAVNREVVPRSAFATHALRDGDRIEILEAVGGG